MGRRRAILKWVVFKCHLYQYIVGNSNPKHHTNEFMLSTGFVSSANEVCHSLEICDAKWNVV